MGSLGQALGKRVDKAWAKSKFKPLLHNIKPAEAKNLFTGLRLKPGVTAMVGLGVAAYAAAKVGSGVANRGRNTIRPVDMGQAPYLDYDTGMQGRKDLGATGDIVFGMHRRR